MQLKELTVLDFAAVGAAAEDAPGAVLAGWEAPEDGRRWARGPRTHITLARPAANGDLVLLLTVDPFLFPPLLTHQTLRVQANGVTLRLAHIRHRTVLACRLRRALLGDADEIAFTFEHPDIVRPNLVSASTDSRDYSIGFIALALLETPAEVAAAPLARPPTPPPVELPPEEALDDAALLEYFASLGDNCEFGLKQRAAGVEPMDLLRFSGIHLSGLLKGVANGFQDIDACDEVELEVHGEVREYVNNVRRYALQSHTGIFEGGMPPARVLSRELKKLRMMRRLFVADLAAGNRVFVYKRNDPIGVAQLGPLLAQLRAGGDCTLLNVTLSDAAHPPGSVEVLADGLLRGYVDRFNPYDNASQPSSPAWLAVCREAYRLWRESRMATTPPLRMVSA